MKVLKIIGVVLAVLPFVRKIIEQVEIPGFGPEKRQAVLDALRGIIGKLPWKVADDVADAAIDIIGGLIDMVVGVLNLIGHDWKDKSEGVA